jgi:hypothetical protein
MAADVGTQSAATCSYWFLALGFFYPEDGDNTFLRNGATSQKTAFFIVTAVKTSNLTYCFYVYSCDKRVFHLENGGTCSSEKFGYVLPDYTASDMKYNNIHSHTEQDDAAVLLHTHIRQVFYSNLVRDTG